jgi:hypothetical protein
MAGDKKDFPLKFKHFNIFPLAREFLWCLPPFGLENSGEISKKTKCTQLKRNKYDLQMPNSNINMYETDA